MNNIPAVTSEIADRIANAIGGEVSRSNMSASVYVDVSVETAFDADGEATEWAEFCVRVSEHEARSYNRAGDYSIFVGPKMTGDCHAFVRAEWIEEDVSSDIETEDYDDEGKLVTVLRTFTETEHRFDFDADAVENAISAACAAFARFKLKKERNHVHYLCF